MDQPQLRRPIANTTHASKLPSRKWKYPRNFSTRCGRSRIDHVGIQSANLEKILAQRVLKCASANCGFKTHPKWTSSLYDNLNFESRAFVTTGSMLLVNCLIVFCVILTFCDGQLLQRGRFRRIAALSPFKWKNRLAEKLNQYRQRNTKIICYGDELFIKINNK